MRWASRRVITTCTGRAWPSRRAQYEQVASVDREAWREELALHDELFDKLKARLPQALSETKAKFESRLAD